MKNDIVARKDIVAKALKYIILIIFAVTCVYPVIWLIINSLKTNDSLVLEPWSIPKVIQWENYKDAWVDGHIGKYFMNSVVVCSISMVFALILSTMAAFAITRLKWKLSGFVLGVFLSGVMIPIHSTLIPLFIMFTKLHISNTYLSLILPYVTFALPMAIFILTGFMRDFPTEIEESAVMDGASMITIFLKMMIPIIKPAIATVTIYTFISMWNELIYAIVFLNKESMMTLPVGLTNFKGEYTTNWVAMIAAVVIGIVPTITVYIFLNGKIIQGMTAGAVKG